MSLHAFWLKSVSILESTWLGPRTFFPEILGITPATIPGNEPGNYVDIEITEISEFVKTKYIVLAHTRTESSVPATSSQTPRHGTSTNIPPFTVYYRPFPWPGHRPSCLSFLQLLETRVKLFNGVTEGTTIHYNTIYATTSKTGSCSVDLCIRPISVSPPKDLVPSAYLLHTHRWLWCYCKYKQWTVTRLGLGLVCGR